MYGSEIIAKDVLEYVVFEKHLANEYGEWRIHDKIIPDWMPDKEPSALTHKRILRSETQLPDSTAITDTKAAPETNVKLSDNST